MLSGFLGRMGTTRGHGRAVGEVMRGCGFEAKVVEASVRLRGVELRFDRPIASDRNRLFKVQSDGMPEEWRPAPSPGPGKLKPPG
jgi:hypothetical protein